MDHISIFMHCSTWHKLVQELYKEQQILKVLYDNVKNIKMFNKFKLQRINQIKCILICYSKNKYTDLN